MRHYFQMLYQQEILKQAQKEIKKCWKELNAMSTKKTDPLNDKTQGQTPIAPTPDDKDTDEVESEKINK